MSFVSLIFVFVNMKAACMCVMSNGGSDVGSAELDAPEALHERDRAVPVPAGRVLRLGQGGGEESCGRKGQRDPVVHVRSPAAKIRGTGNRRLTSLERCSRGESVGASFRRAAGCPERPVGLDDRSAERRVGKEGVST